MIGSTALSLDITSSQVLRRVNKECDSACAAVDLPVGVQVGGPS
jgi:hypothetical protein